MIISDLNYLENTSEEVLGGTSSTGSFNVAAIKNVAIVADVNEKFNINKNVKSNVVIKGSLATAETQATAFGPNTIAQVFSFTNTDVNSSSANGFSVSGTNR
ncbi:hypothetical protein [Nostoc sp.]|uniref:hypothetical protein n=1 Tax=Nostoc sp. TaxID=1180 RepID=UPI002FF7BE3F